MSEKKTTSKVSTARKTVLPPNTNVIIKKAVPKKKETTNKIVKKKEDYFFQPPTMKIIDEHYEFSKIIGQGTYGEVYIGVHKETQRDVAIKKMRITTNNEGVLFPSSFLSFQSFLLFLL